MYTKLAEFIEPIHILCTYRDNSERTPHWKFVYESKERVNWKFKFQTDDRQPGNSSLRNVDISTIINYSYFEKV